MKNNPSHRELILRHLESGKALSEEVSHRLFNFFNLRNRVCEIRRDHEKGKYPNDIYGVMVQHGDRRFKVYYMENSTYFKSHGKKW